jgi:predicted nucleotidyltransferase
MPELSSRFGVRHLLVFGSFARGTPRPDSDVDLLVEFDRNVSLLGLASLRARLEAILGREVEVGTLDSLRPAARDEVMQEALRVA